MEKVINTFKVLANRDRLKIIKLLQEKGELSAKEVESNFYLEQSTVSHHLNKLLQVNILEVRKEGRYRFYKVEEDAFDLLMKMVGKIFKGECI